MSTFPMKKHKSILTRAGICVNTANALWNRRYVWVSILQGQSLKGLVGDSTRSSTKVYTGLSTKRTARPPETRNISNSNSQPMDAFTISTVSQTACSIFDANSKSGSKVKATYVRVPMPIRKP